MKDKVPFYNIANMFFVGAVFCIMLLYLFVDKIFIAPQYAKVANEWSVLVSALFIIVMYEVGFILNRISSVFIEPILTKTKLWPRDNYDIDVSEISETNSKFQSMITEINLMRSHILLYTVFAIMSAILGKWWLFLAAILLVLVFGLGGRKHNAKINKIRKSYAEAKKYEQQFENLLNYAQEVSTHTERQNQ